MAKSSGLGRGLGDLLDDNTPSARTHQAPTVVVRSSAENTPEVTKKPLPNTLYEIKTKPLFESPVRTKRIK